MMKINWEKIATLVANDISNSEDFEKFCNEHACALEDGLHEMIETKFTGPVEDNFRFDFENRGDDASEDRFEFKMTLSRDLMHAFLKYFVTQYLGMEMVEK